MIQIVGVYTTFCHEEGIFLQKYRDRNGKSVAMLFKSIGVKGQCHSPDVSMFQKTAHLQPGFSAGLGCLVPGLPFLQQFSSFKCRFSSF